MPVEKLGDEMLREMGLPAIGPAPGGPAAAPTAAAGDVYGRIAAERYGDPMAQARERSRFETGVEMLSAMTGASALGRIGARLGATGIRAAALRGIGAGLGDVAFGEITRPEAEDETANLDRAARMARGMLGEAIGLKANDWFFEPIGQRVVSSLASKPVLWRAVAPFSRKLEPSARAAIEALGPKGALPTPGQLSEGSAVDRIENVIEASVLGGPILRGQRAKAQKEATRQIQNIVEGFRRGPAEDVGMLLDIAMSNGVEAHRAAVRASAENLDRMAAGVRVDVGEVLDAAKASRKAAETLYNKGEVLRSVYDFVLGTGRKTVRPGIGAPRGAVGRTVERFQRPRSISFKEAQELRSVLLEMERAPTDLIPARTAAAAEHYAGLVDEAIERSARGVGGDLYEYWRNEFNPLVKMGKKGFNNRLTKQLMGQAAPERIYNQLVHAPASHARWVRSVVEKGISDGTVDPDTWIAVQGEWMHEILSKAADPVSGQPSGRKILAQIQTAGPERMKALFPQDQGKTFERAARTLELAQRSASKESFGAVAMRLYQAGALISLPVAFTAGRMQGAAATQAAAILLSPLAMAYIFRNQTATRLLTTGMTSGPTKAAARAMGQFVTHLDEWVPRGSAFVARPPAEEGTAPGALPWESMTQGTSVPNIMDLERK